MATKRHSRKVKIGIVLVIVFAILLCVTTFALIYSMISTDSHVFETGYIKINLNGDEPVITEDEIVFEPGMTVVKDFYIENLSSWSVYYKVYFANVKGEFAEDLHVTIAKGKQILYEGAITELTQDNVKAADDELAIGEKRVLTVTFHFSPRAGNDKQNRTLSFEVGVDATQTKNNSDRLFY